MSQVGIEVERSKREVLDIHAAVKHVLESSGLPFDLEYASTRVMQRIKKIANDTQDLQRLKLKKYAKHDEETGQMVRDPLTRNVVFESDAAEQEFKREVDALLDETVTFYTYVVPVDEMLKELRTCKYGGPKWFMEPLLGIVIADSDELRKEEAARKQASLEAVNNGEATKGKKAKA